MRSLHRRIFGILLWTGVRDRLSFRRDEQKVVLLYRRELEKRVSLLITGNSLANCTLVPYLAAEEVEAFIDSNLRDGQWNKTAVAP